MSERQAKFRAVEGVSFLRPGTTEAMLARLRGGGEADDPVRAVSPLSVDKVATNILSLSSGIVPVADSRGLGWSNVFATRVDEAPHNTLYGTASVFWVAMPLTATFVHRRLDGKDEEGAQDCCAINIISPGSKKCVQLDQPTDMLHFFLNPALINEVASEMAGKTLSDVSLRPVFNGNDPELGHLLRAIDRSLADTDDASRMKMDYLSRALCVDLLTQYSIEPITLSGFKPMLEGLSRRQIVILQDYLESHLGQSIHINDLASLCGVSVTAFSHRFKASTGVTPYQYLMQMCLNKAKKLLAESNMSIAEIAITCGFTDQAHFTNVFGRRTGLPPAQFRKMS